MGAGARRTYRGGVLSPPAGLREDSLAAVLAGQWGLGVTSMRYQPVGFGSHHWSVCDSSGGRWFVTVDELQVKRVRQDEPASLTFSRLSSAFAAAIGLSESGRDFVVAPVRTAGGAPLARLGGEFAVTLYPHVTGQSFGWGDFSAPGHRQAVLDLVVAVHGAPAAVSRLAPADDYQIAHLDELESALINGAEVIADCGPFSGEMAVLFARHGRQVRRLIRRYYALVAQARADPGREVLTHGEPHPGNTMLTAAGWRLIDWDTAMLALPERDLWDLDPGDGSVLAGYAQATGREPVATALDLFRIRWDLADIAVDASRFRRPHSGTEDDVESWRLLRSIVERIAAS